MQPYEVALIHKGLDGVKSKPLIVLNVDALDDETAKREARIVAERHRLPEANAFLLVRGFQPIFEDWLAASSTANG